MTRIGLFIVVRIAVLPLPFRFMPRPDFLCAIGLVPPLNAVRQSGRDADGRRPSRRQYPRTARGSLLMVNRDRSAGRGYFRPLRWPLRFLPRSRVTSFSMGTSFRDQDAPAGNGLSSGIRTLLRSVALF